uniref:Ion_trans domain-containing protein n=1 Tax=Macrostomum lignano TaxID=282301 RepID=A0A1I8I3Q7_9PLAT
MPASAAPTGGPKAASKFTSEFLSHQAVEKEISRMIGVHQQLCTGQAELVASIEHSVVVRLERGEDEEERHQQEHQRHLVDAPAETRRLVAEQWAPISVGGAASSLRVGCRHRPEPHRLAGGVQLAGVELLGDVQLADDEDIAHHQNGDGNQGVEGKIQPGERLLQRGESRAQVADSMGPVRPRPPVKVVDVQHEEPVGVEQQADNQEGADDATGALNRRVGRRQLGQQDEHPFESYGRDEKHAEVGGHGGQEVAADAQLHADEGAIVAKQAGDPGLEQARQQGHLAVGNGPDQEEQRTAGPAEPLGCPEFPVPSVEQQVLIGLHGWERRAGGANSNTSYLRHKVCEEQQCLKACKFVDKKQSGTKIVYVIDSQGEAGKLCQRYSNSPRRRGRSNPKAGLHRQLFIFYGRRRLTGQWTPAVYHPNRKTQKWFQKLGFHVILLLVGNACIVYQNAEGTKSFLSFLEVAIKDLTEQSGPGRRCVLDRVGRAQSKQLIQLWIDDISQGRPNLVQVKNNVPPQVLLYHVLIFIFGVLLLLLMAVLATIEASYRDQAKGDNCRLLGSLGLAELQHAEAADGSAALTIWPAVAADESEGAPAAAAPGVGCGGRQLADGGAEQVPESGASSIGARRSAISRSHRRNEACKAGTSEPAWAMTCIRPICRRKSRLSWPAPPHTASREQAREANACRPGPPPQTDRRRVGQASGGGSGWRPQRMASRSPNSGLRQLVDVLDADLDVGVQSRQLASGEAAAPAANCQVEKLRRQTASCLQQGWRPPLLSAPLLRNWPSACRLHCAWKPRSFECASAASRPSRPARSATSRSAAATWLAYSWRARSRESLTPGLTAPMRCACIHFEVSAQPRQSWLVQGPAEIGEQWMPKGGEGLAERVQAAQHVVQMMRLIRVRATLIVGGMRDRRRHSELMQLKYENSANWARND